MVSLAHSYRLQGYLYDVYHGLLHSYPHAEELTTVATATWQKFVCLCPAGIRVCRSRIHQSTVLADRLQSVETWLERDAGESGRVSIGCVRCLILLANANQARSVLACRVDFVPDAPHCKVRTTHVRAPKDGLDVTMSNEDGRHESFWLPRELVPGNAVFSTLEERTRHLRTLEQ